MTRQQLEHIIRAAGSIANDPDIVVIGSQAILGAAPDAPSALLVSMEADVYPKNKPELSDLIDGSIGEGSYFHETFGYYAQGVDASTAVLPAGWESRLIQVFGPNTAGITGWCLEPHDLVVSKLIAAREKDVVFANNALASGLVERDELLRRLEDTEADAAVLERAKSLTPTGA